MTPPPPFAAALALLLFFAVPALCWRQWPNANSTDLLFGGSKKYEGSFEFAHLKYHMGPVLTANITVNPIWYGTWRSSQKRIIREFIDSISATSAKHPSVADWWKTVQLYTDQIDANISCAVRVDEQKNDRFYLSGPNALDQ